MKNLKDLLIDATKYPAAIEAKLPAGAPKISSMLIDTAGRLPTMPDFPIDIPALPEPPTMPTAPAAAAAPVAAARVTTARPAREIIPLVFE